MNRTTGEVYNGWRQENAFIEVYLISLEILDTFKLTMNKILPFQWALVHPASFIYKLAIFN